MSVKRTLRVRTVLNMSRLPQSVRRLAPLLALLFLLPAFSGCIGGPSVTWGTGNGEYGTDLSSDSSTGIHSISVTNKLSASSDAHLDADEIELYACENSTFSVSGWLVQTKVFDQPTEAVTQPNSYAITSWIVKEMSYNDAQDVEAGSITVSFVDRAANWDLPTKAEATPGEVVDGNFIMDTGKPREFPHADWALLAIIPANENVFEAALQMDSNQAVELSGYLRTGESSPNLEDCEISTDQDGWKGHFVVTSMKYGSKERFVDADEDFVAGDIPFVGRGLYTTILLISIIASGALYIFSRNQLILNADTQAQAMLSDQQMRAGKAARHEAARHEARMEASAKAKEAEYTGRPTQKTSVAPSFDIGAALAEDTPGTRTEHYVAGSSVTSTDDADAMEDMISEMQEEREFEQELQEKGLRGIIGDASRGGAHKRRSIATKPHTSRLSSEPEEDSEPEQEPKRRATKRTRKTKPKVAESEPVEEEPVRRVDPDVNDEGDFSDFSL